MKELEELIVGFWGEEKTPNGVEWRYMCPQLNYFANYHTMVLQENKTRILSRPNLLDINWTLFNCWFICRGFSGFEEDEEYTCNWVVKLKEDKLLNDNLPDIPLKYINTLTDNCYKKNGLLKKYVDPLEYLNKTHKLSLGIPLYENNALNFFVLGTRGGGKSHIASSVMEHEWMTDGCKTLESFLLGKNKVEIFCGSASSTKSSALFQKFMDSQKNLPGAYQDRDYYPPPFSRVNSGTLKVGNSKTPFKFEYEKKIGNNPIKQGTGSVIIHETFKDNKQAAVGGRYNVLVVEEVGLEEKILEVHGANESTQDMGNGKFGSSYYLGTGGNMEKVIESERIFRDPEGYSFLAFKDIYEGRGLIGFFLPSVYSNLGYKDKMGNTDVETSLKYEMEERELRKKNNNTSAYDQYIMSRPLKPSEMFLSKTGNKFPIVMLREQQAENDRYEYKKHLRTIGYLLEDKNVICGVKFKPDFDLKPIDRFPHDVKGSIEGVWEIYEHPPAGIVPSGLYKVIYDPIKDEGGGSSLAAIYVYKSNNTIDANGNELIAWWVGRFDKPDDIHNQCVMSAKYYNAQVMFENNIIDFKNYCMRMGCYHILASTPKQIIERALRDPTFKYDVGIPMTTPLKQYALRLAQQWLLDNKKAYTEELIDGTSREVIVRNLHTIKDNLLLEELIQYNDKGNFDRVSAFLLLMLWIEQDKEVVIKEAEEVSQLTAKDFYSNLYSNRLKNNALVRY